MHFDTLEEYLEAYRGNAHDHGVLPIPLVAEHLDKSAPAVTAMLKAGTLTEISIGRKNRFVQVASLLERAADEVREEDVVRQYLLDMIKRGETYTFYEPLMAMLGLVTTTPAHRTKIGAILDRVSRKSYDEKKVVLSVLVHRKTSGTTRPGPGFFGMVEAVGLYDPEHDDQDEFIAKHTKVVMKKYGQ